MTRAIDRLSALIGKSALIKPAQRRAYLDRVEALADLAIREGADPGEVFRLELRACDGQELQRSPMRPLTRCDRVRAAQYYNQRLKPQNTKEQT